MNDWFSDEKATFGDRLASAREAASLSQDALARKLGVTKKAVQAWEGDVSEPRANRLQMLAGLLNVSLMWLMSGQGEGIAPPVSDEPPTPEEVSAVLTDLSLIRAEMERLVTRAIGLEQRLRQLARQ